MSQSICLASIFGVHGFLGVAWVVVIAIGAFVLFGSEGDP